VERLPDGKPHPKGFKPYLESNGTRIERPGAIFNYINEIFDGPSLLPDDEAGRARCRGLAT
jgi:glutathione S-transferase